MGRFNFVGEVIIPKNEERFIKQWANDKGTEMVSLNFGIKANNSVSYVELFGVKNDEIKTRDKDNNEISIPWGSRFNTEVVNTVASYRKNIVRIPSMECEQEFITSYDAACKLAEVLRDFKGQLCVTGDCERSPYITKSGEKVFNLRYTIRNVYEQKVESKSKLNVNEEIFFNKTSIDTSDMKENKRVYVNGYIRQYLGKNTEKYIGEAGKQFYIPQQFVLDFSKIDFEDKMQKKMADYILGCLTKNVSDKKMYSASWACSVIDGAEEVPFDESQLTEQQKMQIEFGLSTLDDFKPRDSIFGARIHEIRLVKPNLIGEYTNGNIELPESVTEFEEEIAVFIEPETLNDVMAEATIAGQEAVSEINDDTFGDMLDDLLG